MRRASQIVILFLLAWIGNPAFAASCIPGPAIIGGTEVSCIPREWQAVRLLNVAGGRCSGVFIDELHMLTAAHCVRWNDGTDLLPGEVSLEPDGETSQAIMVHEGYGSGPIADPDYDHDVAIARFAPRTDRPFARIAATRSRRGDRITMVGYGRAVEEDPGSGGVLRAGSNTVHGFRGTHIEVRTGKNGPEKHSAILGSGDSGGPWFNAAGEVVGISSLGTLESSSAVSTQAPAIRRFLRQKSMINHRNY